MKIDRQYRLYLCALIGASCLAFGAPQPIVSVVTEKAMLKPIFNLLTFPARVESKVNAVVRSEADGAVTEIIRQLGSRVRRGETIAIIKHTDPVYEFAPLSVIASICGVVNEVHVTPGSLVNKGDPIVTVTDPSHLRVMIEVAAYDLSAIRQGLKGEMTFPGVGQPLNAEVKGISPSIDPMLGTASCELQVAPNAQKSIVAGMVGRVQFKVNQRQGFLLPDFAIVYRGDNTFVRTVKDGKATKVPVKLGERRQGQVEILSGISSGDEVIERASRFVADGAPVKVEAASE
jgi:multidrug efflux pump subunit AcrA (membrane-fusion protein)